MTKGELKKLIKETIQENNKGLLLEGVETKLNIFVDDLITVAKTTSDIQNNVMSSLSRIAGSLTTSELKHYFVVLIKKSIDRLRRDLSTIDGVHVEDIVNSFKSSFEQLRDKLGNDIIDGIMKY